MNRNTVKARLERHGEEHFERKDGKERKEEKEAPIMALALKFTSGF
jgi:hypothetical protein